MATPQGTNFSNRKGINSDQVASLRARYGYNELPAAKQTGVWTIALETIREPMFLMLMACGMLYVLIGDYREGIILILTFFIIIAITFLQRTRTQRALDALKKLASPRVLVVRDGRQERIPGRDLLPGDLVLLSEGDRIGADMQLIQTSNLEVDESLLTGESMPVSKGVEAGANEVYSGTLVVKGKASALVTATGMQAGIGHIAGSLMHVEDQETRLQKEMKQLTRRLALAGVFISISVFGIFWLTRGDLVHAFLTGISSAMAIMPEEFPVVFTVFMALGAWRLSSRHVLTRKPSAIETLGSATVLCCDKTGTITLNKMQLTAVIHRDGILSRRDFAVGDEKLGSLLKGAGMASHLSPTDPMEKAIAEAGEIFLPAEPADLELIREYPLSNTLLSMTMVYRDRKTGESHVYAKGSPEAILGLCRDGRDWQQDLQQLAGQGYRMLGIARATKTHEPWPERQEDFGFELLGFVAFEDPVRPEVPAAVQECLSAGVRVVMITGDHPATAASIARQCGIPHDKVVTGDELRQADAESLPGLAAGAGVFARVSPGQKLDIVKALQARGEVVAMTGDGVNDAPALKSAHIGIAMGNKGTDVAREAASLVLLDDNFASVVAAIRLGRRIFDNLQKAMAFIFAVHIPIIGLALLPAFFATFPILLMPLHIVFLELIIDPVCSVAFESEGEEANIMNRPPRSQHNRFFSVPEMGFSALRGGLLLLMVVAVYLLSLQEGHSEGEVRAIAFSALITGNILLIISGLSQTRSFVRELKTGNRSAALILTLSLLLLATVLLIPAIREIFSFEWPGWKHFYLSATGAVLLLVALETIKYLRFRRI